MVAFPTETVYGLGACAISSKAVSKIYQTKGRPSDNPLIVHIDSLQLLSTFLPPDWNLPTVYQILIQRFWPGPLTVLVPTTSAQQPVSKIPDIVTCGLSTVAVRIPSHPIARALIGLSKSPIAAPSANLSGRPSPTRAEHVKRDLEGRIELVLDGGPCEVGVESTVIDGLNPDGPLRVLRLGGLSVEDITQCLSDAQALGTLKDLPLIDVYNPHGKVLAPEIKPTTPGMKYKHYSPKAKVLLIRLVEAEDMTETEDLRTSSQLIDDLCAANTPTCPNPKVMSIGLMLVEDGLLLKQFKALESNLDSSRSILQHSSLGRLDRPDISAQRLFSAMRYLDEEALVDIILVEALPEYGLGSTVMERLYKAAGSDKPQGIKLSSS